jgi:Fur family transcriptional regulator, ferric uptake regulator
VTVYHILDLLVENAVVERISTGGRAFYYCLAPESLAIDTEPLWRRFPGRIDKVEICIDGICENCDKQKAKMNSFPI